MKNLEAHTFVKLPNRRQTLLAMMGTALLHACGGGTATAGLSSGGTGSFTTGTIVGLGSVIVNGIRYDDSAATIASDLGTSTAEALRLGMVVRIQGSSITPPTLAGALSSATASRIDYSSEWKGTVTSVDTAVRRFTLLDQVVHVLPTTIFSDGSFDQTLQGRHVEVYGFLNPVDGSLQATRVEVKVSPLSDFRLAGVVNQLNATTFLLGTALINHASANDKPANLRDGMLVRVELKLTANSSGQWIATEVRESNSGDALDDDDEAEIEGTITAFTSSASFSVNGIAVDASRISPPSGLALGVRVELKGAISAGQVIATKVEIEDENEALEYEFHGAVSALDTVAKTFVIRGYTVRYIDSQAPGATRFKLDGRAWSDGLLAEVKARLDANADLLATEIEAEH